MAVGATPEQIRIILQHTLGQLGPEILADGQINDDGDERLTLVEKLKKPDIAKPPGPSIFGGTLQENLVEWCDRIIDHIDHAGYRNDEEKLRVVRMYLKGRAAIWYKNLDDTNIATFDTLKVACNSSLRENLSTQPSKPCMPASNFQGKPHKNILRTFWSKQIC